MKYFLDIQFGRELEEDEVLRINYILKRLSSRYIAAAEEEWQSACCFSSIGHLRGADYITRSGDGNS